MPLQLYLGGHRGMGCTDHEFYSKRLIGTLPVENTVESIEAAFLHGADYVEIDAVMSADDILFAIHNVVPNDHFFLEESPQALLNTLPFSEIRRFRSGRSGAGVVRPLKDSLAAIAALDPGTLPWAVNIEAKGVQGSGQPYETNGFIEKLADELQKSALEPARVLWSSFCLQNLLELSHRLPQSHFGILFGEKAEPRPIYADHKEDLRWQYLPLREESLEQVLAIWEREACGGVPLKYLHPEVTTVTDSALHFAALHKMGINVWALFEEIDSERNRLYRELQRKTAELQVPFTIITDYLDVCRRQLRELT